jgi:hypothetical protein
MYGLVTILFRSSDKPLSKKDKNSCEQRLIEGRGRKRVKAEEELPVHLAESFL